MRSSRGLLVEGVLVASLWSLLIANEPRFFLASYLPGIVLGLFLSFLQGRHEHLHGTTSHEGALYNVLFFNDGHHVEHHMRPAAHWSTLGRARTGPVRTSRFPPVLRWLEAFSLTGLERLVCRSRLLQRLVLCWHRGALARQLADLESPPREVAIVGGGLYPRTALLLSELLPEARLTIVERSAENARRALAFLAGPRSVRLLCAHYDRDLHTGFDLVVFPLCYDGDRDELYRDPPAARVLVHDWLHRRRGRSVLVHPLLWKRLNRVGR